MSKNEEMIRFVDSSMRLEGMVLSSHEKRIMMDCLTGKTTFEGALVAVLRKYKQLVR